MAIAGMPEAIIGMPTPPPEKMTVDDVPDELKEQIFNELQKDIAEDYLADQQSDEMKIAANENKTDADLLDSSGDDSFDDLAKATFIKKK